MAMFVDPNQRVAVKDEKGNTVWIRAKMDAATKARVMDQVGAKGLAGNAEEERDPEMSGLGSYQLALLLENIVAWEGPDFVDGQGRPIPCNRRTIRALNQDDLLIEKVGEEIGKRNARPQSPDPNLPTTAGCTDAGG